MSHMIDMTNSRANIAYAGDVPWHGLGRNLTAGATLQQWEQEAGLAHTVRESFVRYATSRDNDVPLQVFKDRKVLFRNDTLAPLSVVGAEYQVVQPREVLGFFKEMVETAGFSLETAGCLSGGKRVWALAKVNDGANVIGRDRVLPYVLLATSYDGTMATTAKFTGVRVVCHNTISLAIGSRKAAGEIRVPHSTKFDRDAVRRDLGVAVNAFDEWLIEAKRLAAAPLTLADAETLTAKLIAPHTSKDDVKEAAGYKRIMGLFTTQAAIGAAMTQGPTLWAWLNSVTETVDHNTGRTADTRMSSAWFGAGDRLKSDAQRLALDLIA